MTFAQFQLVMMLAGVGLVLVWVPRALYWRRWRKHAQTATTFLMKPAGKRPDDLDKAATSVSATLDALGSRRNAGVTLHRYLDGNTVRSAVTVYGHKDPADIARSFAASVGAAVDEGDDDFEVPTPGVGWYARRMDFINRDPNDRELPPLGEGAEWVQQTLASGEGGACVSIGVEPMARWDARLLRRWYNIRSALSTETEGIGPGRACRVMVTCWSDDETVASQIVAGLPGHLHRWPFTVSARVITSVRSWVASALALAFATVSLFVVAVVAALFRRLSDSLSGLAATAQGDDANGGGAVDAAADQLMGAAFSPGQWLVSPWAIVALVATGVCAVMAVVSWRATNPMLNRAQAVYARMHQFGVVPVERTPTWSLVRVSKMVVGKMLPVDLQQKFEGQQRSINYPYRPRTLAFNAQHVTEALAFPPMYETAQEISDVARVPAPPQFTDAVAPAGGDVATLVGHDADGRAIKVLDEDRKHGVFIVGDPGSGKSYSCLRLWREDATSRLAEPRRRDGRMSMLWLETKGDGADQAERALRLAGYQPGQFGRFDLAAPAGLRLEVLDRTRPELTAARLVGAFTYAFETGAVGPRAAEAMRAAFTIALSVTPDIADVAGLPREWPNVLHVAIVLMGDGGRGTKRHALLAAFQHAAMAEYRAMHGVAPQQVLVIDDPGVDETSMDDATGVVTQRPAEDLASSTGSPLYDALRAWSYYEQMNRRQRAEILDSPRNKLTAIASLHHLWTPDPQRRDVTLPQLVEGHGVAILNFGSSLHGAVDQMTASRVAAITLYLLWEEIKSSCAGWVEQGRSIGIYADELTHLSGTGSGNDIIEEMRDKGRSAGVQLTLATQRYAQLPQRTVHSTKSFGARAYMTTENIEHATEAAIDLNGGPEGRITPRDVRELPQGWCAIRMRHRGAGLPPFTFKVAHPFEGDTAPPPAATFAPTVGWDDESVTTVSGGVLHDPPAQPADGDEVDGDGGFVPPSWAEPAAGGAGGSPADVMSPQPQLPSQADPSGWPPADSGPHAAGSDARPTPGRAAPSPGGGDTDGRPTLAPRRKLAPVRRQPPKGD